ncbi:MAG: tRNA guanosine(34) transglycosylase Tgt [Victivallaceae bacterium]
MVLKFTVLHCSKKSGARLGLIETSHGIIETPTFVPVGTNAALKGVIDSSDIDLMFCNTYHLMLQPGTSVIKKMGGLHGFMKRNRPLITDSGGFQAFSLAYGSVAEEIKSCGKKRASSSVVKISEEGILFRSYRDGRQILLSPEISIASQKDLGADIIIPFDELPPYHIGEQELIQSCERTYRWELRSLDSHKKNIQGQSMYGIVHGGMNKVLRKEGCCFVSDHDFDGFAIGGSVGKNRQDVEEIVTFITSHLPSEKPRHLLGIGDPFSIQNLIATGIDSFDSSYPTKAARHGMIFSKEKGFIKIKQSKYSEDLSPIDSACCCHTCKTVSLGYLHHLFKAYELNGLSLASIHNLHYMNELMKIFRQKIVTDEL